jgi:hypothetical protein
MGLLSKYAGIASVLAALATCAASYSVGRFHQGAIGKNNQLAAQVASEKLAGELALRLAFAEMEIKKRGLELEEAAYADPASDNLCFSSDRVRRLNLR